MKTFISILRGINVSGQKLIRMSDLERIYLDLGFQEVTTYIQSGNVVFRSANHESSKKLSAKIEQALFINLGFHVPVIIRTIEEMSALISANPYKKESENTPGKLYVTFLEEEPQPDNIKKISPTDYFPDKFTIQGKEIFLNCAAGYGTTKLSNSLFERKLNIKATSRNWRTANKLLELATQIENG